MTAELGLSVPRKVAREDWMIGRLEDWMIGLLDYWIIGWMGLSLG